MRTSKAAVAIHMILGKIASIIGYFFGLMFCISIVTPETRSEISVIAVFLGISVFGIMKGFKTKKRIKRFKKYVWLISSEYMTSLEEIANSTSQSVDFVIKDLQQMINKKFFANAVIDMSNNKIIIRGREDHSQNNISQAAQNNMQVENETVVCSGCGAVSTRPKGGTGECEYCGSVIK